MLEIKEKNELEKREVAQPEMGGIQNSEIGKCLNNTEQLSEEELNKPIDDIGTTEKASLDCRSECKYNTGDRSKYSNYGFSG